MNRILCHIVLVCLLVGCGVVTADGQTQEQESKVIVLHNADTLRGLIIDGEEARELIGRVHISQGSVQIHCDRALQYVSRGLVVAIGHVLVNDGQVTLMAPRGAYHRDERMMEAFDSVQMDDGKMHLDAQYGRYEIEPKIGFFRTGVVIRDSASTITADSLTYFRDVRRSLAEGHVSIYSPADRMTITGGRLEHEAIRQFSRMTLQPQLLQTDSAASGSVDTLVVRSQVMEAYRDTTRRFLAIDSVRMVRHELAAIAGLATFYMRGDSIYLRNQPVVWYEDTQVSGDSLNVYLRNRRLRLVHVMGNARAMSLSDSLLPGRFDQMTGETMLMHFENQQLREIDVNTQAISLYHVYEDSLANGLNKTSGDRIVMLFADGRVRTITVQGGVEGAYVPENVLRRTPDEYALPGLRWRTDRPTMQSLLAIRNLTEKQRKAARPQSMRSNR